MTVITESPDSLASLQLVRGAETPLATQLADALSQRIATQAWRPGARLPSIRTLAEQLGVSRQTVVDAYDRLVAQGLLQSRHGAGFFVQSTTPPLELRRPAKAEPPPRLDVAWLLRRMFSEADGGGASAGMMPAEWMDSECVAAAVRAVGRRSRHGLLSYGEPQGYAPLRTQVAARLAQHGINADPELNLMTTVGVTHGVDLVARLLVQPGDAVLVEDPAWFVLYGRLAAFGARLIPVTRGPRGYDMEQLEQLARTHKPKLFIINGLVHNPTGYSLPATMAYEVLRLAERHDFHVLEDDTYGDLHPGGALRLAALDGLRRVIHLGGYSKILAAGLRVGYLAAEASLLERLVSLKLLTGLTTPGLGERVIHRILADGAYRHLVERIRGNADAARADCQERLLALGLRIDTPPVAGVFLWADCGRDSEALARDAALRGLLLAPGMLFSPAQAPSTWMRFSAAMVLQPEAWRILREVLAT